MRVGSYKAFLLPQGLQPFEDPSHGKAPLWEASCNKVRSSTACDVQVAGTTFSEGTSNQRQLAGYVGYVLSCLVSSISILAWLLVYWLKLVS